MGFFSEWFKRQPEFNEEFNEEENNWDCEKLGHAPIQIVYQFTDNRTRKTECLVCHKEL